MNYIFILGNHPTLSTAEIHSILPNADLNLINLNCLQVNNAEINPQELIKKIGGTIKIAQIIKTIPKNKIYTLPHAIFKEIDLTKFSGKIKFGISNYGIKKAQTFKIGLNIKKLIKKQGNSIRLVTSKDKNILSSVIVTQNKLLEQGLEIILTEDKDQIIIAKTEAVQDFKNLSKRDYGRPSRDDHSGMLPPKLAQIMINLANPAKNAQILDPFCGSGTILSEAILMNYSNLIGTDISKKAVNNTKKNLDWLKNHYSLPATNHLLQKIDATKLSKHFKSNSINHIITEVYLGPQRGKINYKKTIQELNTLYSKVFNQFSQIIKKNNKIVIALPIFRIQGKSIHLNPDWGKLNISLPLPQNLRNYKNLKTSFRNTLIYGREGQKVWREIIILIKN